MTLDYVARALVQALGAYALVSSLLALPVIAAWPRVRSSGRPAVQLARQLFFARLVPSAAGGTVAVLVLVAYRLWEARAEAEPVGVFAVAAAAAGAVLLGSGAARLVRALHHTAHVRRRLAEVTEGPLPAFPLRASVVGTHFPVVALAGLTVPRLFVARRVLEACTAKELAAVVAHEASHARSRDNLRRVVMVAAPDVLGLLPVGCRLQDSWTIAAELAADEVAGTATSRIDLAAALVKVARLATTPAAPLTASAFYRGEAIAERVHRLLDSPPPRAAARWPRWARLVAPALLLSAALLLLPVLHAAAEQLLALGL